MGAVVAGRYKIENLLGIGGMGAVYRAQHVYMRKTFALKVLHKQMSFVPEVVARFEREAVAASRIEHGNVATAADFGRLAKMLTTAGYRGYIVLEYEESEDPRVACPGHLERLRMAFA